MAVEAQRQRLLELLSEEGAIRPELANGPVSALLDLAFDDIDEERVANGNSDHLNYLFTNWADRIYSWWGFNIRSGVAQVQHVGSENDDFWNIVFDNKRERIEFRLQMRNGKWDSQKLFGRVNDEEGERDKEWEVTLNGQGIESIHRKIYHSHPEGERPSVQDDHTIYRPYDYLRTKPTVSTP